METDRHEKYRAVCAVGRVESDRNTVRLNAYRAQHHVLIRIAYLAALDDPGSAVPGLARHSPGCTRRYSLLGAIVMRYLLMNRLVRAHTDRESGVLELNLAGGDARFREVHSRFYRDVYAYCRRRTDADSVEDAVADTFLTAWKKSDEIPSGDQALPWLYGVAYRVLTHQWRASFRRGRLTQKVASFGSISMSLPEEIVIAGQEHRQLLTALGALGQNDQEILRLTVWEELSHADIAIALGISVGAVRQRFYTAKKKLADEYNRLESREVHSPAAQKGGAW